MEMKYFRSLSIYIVLSILVRYGTVDGAVNSAHFMSLGCHTYAEQDGQLERCQGLYTLERSWADAAAWCKKDGWTGLAVADTDKVEAALGEYMVWMNDELDADDGYSAWIAGQEMEDRQWKWSDATAFQRGAVSVKLTEDEKKFENCVELGVNHSSSTITLTSRMCRTMRKFFICQRNETSSDNSTCQLNGTAGVVLDGSCYAALPGSAVQSRTPWSAGVASWFKANAHCRSVDASLATLDVALLKDANATRRLVDYLAGVSKSEPFWVGLARNPWVWVDEYDEAGGKAVRTSPVYYSDWLEPDQPNKERMDCMSIGGNDGRYGWSSERCERRLPFVCENRTLTLTDTTGSPSNTTAQPADYSAATTIIIACILIAVAVLVLSLVIYWCLCVRPRSGYTTQP